MSILGKFDPSSDFTQFYLWAMIIAIVFTVLMTWVVPNGKQRSRRKLTKVDERVVSVDGELID